MKFFTHITIWILMVVFCFRILKVKCQHLSDNTPPSMYLDRNWIIPVNESVGAIITRVKASDNEDADSLLFGLEKVEWIMGGGSTKPLPFRIDNVTGVVYLNETLKDWGSENLFLYVTVSDGKLTAKTEVWVKIVNTTSGMQHASQKRFNSPAQFPTQFELGGTHIHAPPYYNFPGFHPHVPITNNIAPKLNITQDKIYPVQSANEMKQNVNKNVSVKDELEIIVQNGSNLLLIPKTSTMKSVAEGVSTEMYNLEKRPSVQVPDERSRNGANVTDMPVRSPPDLTITLVPVVSVLAIFLMVGVAALLCRRRICLGKTKHPKDDMQKEPSGGIVLQDDPGLVMQQWRGPRAFSNRYEPWERDGQNGVQHSGIEKRGDQWEFPRHRLKVFDILGEGAFGQVWRCEATDIGGKEGVAIVAVKTLKENATEKERTDLLSELEVMKNLEPHPNVVRLLGCCTEKQPLFVIMEYVSRGKLQSYLRSSRAERFYGNMHGQSKTLTSRDLTSFVYQVARGMEYVSSRGIIHRDLAARNVLINDEHTCKVADFGFARDISASHAYERKSEGRLPIRWMAPESLYDNIFTVKSDVWSFGIFIWEVVTLGSTPYPGLSAAEVMRKVKDGHRLDKPEHCRRELYNIMYYCWDKDPKERPTFAECVALLEKLLLSETDYIELERFPDHSYYNMASLSGEKL